MKAVLSLSVSACALIAGPASSQVSSDLALCQKRVEKVALAAGVPSKPVSDGTFYLQKDKVAIVDGECKGSLSVRPDPEPFDVKLSPSYPGLVVRVAAAGFDLTPAEVRQAMSACLTAAVSDPLGHTGRAGFARQRWRSSQMTGNVVMHRLKWECTYHNSQQPAASLTISKTE